MKILTPNLVLESGAGSGERPPKGITSLGGSGGMLHWEFFVS